MFRRLYMLCICLLAIPMLATAQQNDKPTTIAEKTAGMTAMTGFMNIYWDDQTGKMWLEINKWDQELLYVNGLSAGLGSNDIGLDRGQLGGRRVVTFYRNGPRILMVQPNYRYRADSDDPDEQQAVEDSFAKSVIWGFKADIIEGDRVLVDATDFFLRDAHNVVGRLSGSRQGNYRMDTSRSAFNPDRTKNFPKNTEVDVMLTFTGDNPGGFVRQVTPSPTAITVQQHHSFIELPDADYTPRVFDPRAGYFGINYLDYATPIDQPMTKRFIARHRLKKKNPGARESEAVEPIVYYLDRGTPEPVRSALLDGARWWNQAFEAAGYKDAFRVEVMPEGADPMDVRYNVIQWVHRSTRGWSYGSSITDPRTGEILKGHVSLGSLRVRQDFLLAEGWLQPYAQEGVIPGGMEAMALARLRQLAAHEVGHTIGLSHNYISSTMDLASVMDYPHPIVKSDGKGGVDLSQAYDVGIGAWDKVAVTYGYQDFPQGTDEKKALDGILADAMKDGLYFLTDKDARPPGSAHPETHLWDNGNNAVAELNRLMDLRRSALDRFSEKAIRFGVPMSTLEEVLAPLYLSHRYQVTGAAKTLGGLRYRYALRGDGQTGVTMVPPEEHVQALRALLDTITPHALMIPERVLSLIPPRPSGYSRHRELFPNRTGGTFDPISAAETAADHTLGLIMHPARAARLLEYHARDERYPGLDEVIERVFMQTWKAERQPGLAGEIQRMVDITTMYHLMSLSLNNDTPAQVRAVAALKVTDLTEWLEEALTDNEDPALDAHYEFALAQIELYNNTPERLPLPSPVQAPPGQPIGDPGMACDW